MPETNIPILSQLYASQEVDNGTYPSYPQIDLPLTEFSCDKTAQVSQNRIQSCWLIASDYSSWLLTRQD